MGGLMCTENIWIFSKKVLFKIYEKQVPPTFRTAKVRKSNTFVSN